MGKSLGEQVVLLYMSSRYSNYSPKEGVPSVAPAVGGAIPGL